MGEWQWLLNIGIGIVLTVLGWFARQLWDSVQKLKDDLNNLEVQLPNVYLKQNDFKYHIDHAEKAQADRFNQIMAAINKLYDKLDSKVDK